MWMGACTSSIGTWMQKLAQSWLVLQISGSSLMLGLDSFLGEIPIFLFSLVGGVVADRADRRHLLIASQFVQMTCALLLAALVATDTVRVWHILSLSFLVGLAQAFGGPAYQALIPTLVGPSDLPNAIALNSIQFNLARIVGPVLGGLALTQLGASWCFFLNGLSYIAVVASLLAVRPRFLPAPTEESMLASMKSGISFIRRQASMESLIALAFLTTFLGIPLIIFLPVFVRDVFHQGPSAYTLLLSVSGAGSVAGALAVAAFSHSAHRGRMTLFIIVFLGVCTAAFAGSKSIFLSCVVLFLASAALIAVFALVTSLVQLTATDEMRGRVMSVYNVAFRGGMPIGNLAAGSLIEKFNAPAIIALNGLLLTCLGGYFLLPRRKISSL